MSPLSVKVTGHEEMPWPVQPGLTGADVLAQIKLAWPGDPWHGNQLMSIGAQQLTPSSSLIDTLPESPVAVTLANYSRLCPSANPCSISATELRGIMLEFAIEMVPFWTETFGPERGRTLSFEKFNLYHAATWIIGPATQNATAVGCSYVELVATSAEAQRPAWFVSHAWLEPVTSFVTCLKQHARVRELQPTTPYWVCAYANNQHSLGEEIAENPRKTSFYRAMKLCAGVLLILDQDATPFTRHVELRLLSMVLQ